VVAIIEAYKRKHSPTGQDVYSHIANQLETSELQDMADSLSNKSRVGQYGSDTLKKAGIPGLKYLDAGSRDVGTGTRNYVVFDENIVNIVKKYGIAAALGAGLISEEMAQQMQAQGDVKS
jgi:hypothetical protein